MSMQCFARKKSNNQQHQESAAVHMSSAASSNFSFTVNTAEKNDGAAAANTSGIQGMFLVDCGATCHSE